MTFKFEFDPDLPTIIFSDRTKLNQILMNLVSNALKFTKEGKTVILRAKKESDEWFILEVDDEGIGIPKSRMHAIFKAFEQADGSTTRWFGGTGLGLTITKKMTALLQGSIYLESEEGKGSKFTVKLPLVVNTTNIDQEEEQQESSWKDIKFSPKNCILVVEHDLTNQIMIKALFKELGLTINLAHNGEEGVEFAKKLQPDLILMDMYMPKMDGLQATEAIRKEPLTAEIPIVVLSADAFHETQEKAKKLGVNGYLTKPLEVEKLVSTLQQYLIQEQLTLKTSTDIFEEAEHFNFSDELQEKLLQSFYDLSKVPHFMTGTISGTINEIVKSTDDLPSYFTTLLQKIEDAAFSQKAKVAQQLINNGIHMLKKNKTQP
ncbi:MAG: CheY-like chemotaxis protein [bacterium]